MIISVINWSHHWWNHWWNDCWCPSHTGIGCSLHGLPRLSHDQEKKCKGPSSTVYEVNNFICFGASPDCTQKWMLIITRTFPEVSKFYRKKKNLLTTVKVQYPSFIDYIICFNFHHTCVCTLMQSSGSTIVKPYLSGVCTLGDGAVW